MNYSAPILKKEWSTPIEEGATIPSVTFKTRTRIESDGQNPFDWKDVTSEDLFKGKRVVIFALPGAFTPLCSNDHLPGFEKAYSEIKGLGIDDVYCFAVNDPFVMRQFGLKAGLPEDKTPGALGFMNVKMIPDGSAHFARGMGMAKMWDYIGFGERSWRYSAVINDMTVEKIFVEPTESSFDNSDAGTMIKYLQNVEVSYAAPILKKEWSTPIEEGATIPSVTFKTRTRIESDDQNPFDWKDVTSEDLFKGKKVVLFALPGAFTPVCSNNHLPGFEKAYSEIKGLGIDDVYCLAVNDPFVMRQFGLAIGLPEDKTPGSNGFVNVKMIPDGAAQFTRGMGMAKMWDAIGFGERSWRYSAVINDMKVEKIFVEPTESSFENSDAGTMLSYLKGA